MKLGTVLVACVVVATVVSCGDDDPTSPTADALVSMPGFSFVPFTTAIKVGGKVIFDFPAESHNVIFSRVTGAPEDIQETVNKKVSRQFDVAGTFPYDCTIHPGMSGTVAVTP